MGAFRAGNIETVGQSNAQLVRGSLRFDSASSQYLSRTASAGNQTTFTWSSWVKFSNLSGNAIFGEDGGYPNCFLWHDTDGTLRFSAADAGSTMFLNLVTTQVFRDFSSWYHIVAVYDSSNATSTDRARLYVNGTRITAFSTSTYPNSSVATCLNASGNLNRIGQHSGVYYYNGYISTAYFIDGQALDASYFGFTDPLTNTWRPKKLSSSIEFGTNGFYLPFDDDNAKGTDKSGRGNNWTTNGFSGTSTNPDVVPDSPSGVVYSTVSTAGIGTTTSMTKPNNYCTLNRLTSGFSGTLSKGNLYYDLSSGSKRAEGTIAVNSGKWYWEAYAVSGTRNGTVGGRFGFTVTSSLNNPETTPFQLTWHASNGLYRVNSAGTFTLIASSSYTDGDYLGCALDADKNIGYFYKNNSLTHTFDFSSYVTPGTDFLTPHCWNGSSGTPVWQYTFGQQPFKYTPPSGYLPLCSSNFSTTSKGRPSIVRPDQYVGIVTYLGTSSARSLTVGFKPDFIWFKDRTGAGNHNLHDSVRGSTKFLYSNLANAEGTDANGLISFDPYGFSFGNNPSNNSDGNITGRNTVAWCWKAGGEIGVGRSFMIDNVGFATAGDAGMNTGTITPTGASVNTKSGFSIVTFNSGTGSPTNYTVSHGLGKTPAFIMAKSRTSSSYSWVVYHTSIATTVNKYLQLNTTNVTQDNGSAIWGANLSDTNSTTFGITSGNGVVANTDCIAYLWAEIPGFSKFGSYTGNASDDGPAIITGFRPKWLMIKRTTTTGDDWPIMDAERSKFNPLSAQVWANFSTQESNPVVSSRQWDFTSNGFKIRGTNDAINASGATYIYCAFAETPSSNLYGGQANAR